MSTFLATLLLFALVMGGMALGLAGGRSLKGSCGGKEGSCTCTQRDRRACEQKRRAA
ncbi:MAG: hypothetical protein JRH16_10285 [Deltaproteobacteria bacterium]|nr:hypothetical protein [Deltaproteobacteria bacterium]MBW2359328.1 hypothetical protein [Deltaproteobacteria bacterium]